MKPDYNMIKNLLIQLRERINRPVLEKLDDVNKNLIFMINQTLDIQDIKTMPSIKHLQQEQFKILLQTHEILCENKIDYFLIYGTLLGAIRHQGFIPWDDDIDIGFFSEDFQKLIQIENHFEQKGLRLSSPFSRLGYYSSRGWHRIYDHKATRHISIFIFDLVKTNNIQALLQLRTSYHQKAARLRDKFRKGKISFKKLQSKLLDLSKRYYTEAEFQTLEIANENTYIIKNICNFYLANYSKFKYIFPLQKQPFIVDENQQTELFPIPNNSDEVLQDFYGRDFLNFPSNLYPSHRK